MDSEIQVVGSAVTVPIMVTLCGAWALLKEWQKGQKEIHRAREELAMSQARRGDEIVAEMKKNGDALKAKIETHAKQITDMDKSMSVLKAEIFARLNSIEQLMRQALASRIATRD